MAKHLSRRGHLRTAMAGSAVGLAVLVPMIGGPAAYATTSGPTLTLTPNELYYPCDGTQPVTASVTGFDASATVDLRLSTTTGKLLGTIATDSTGAGSTERDVNTNVVRPGQYTIWAVETTTTSSPAVASGPEASAVFTEGECP